MWYVVYDFLVYIQVALSVKLGDEMNCTELGDKRYNITVPADPMLPVRLTGLECDLKVFGLAVDMRARKRELLVVNDVPQDAEKDFLVTHVVKTK